MAGRSALDIGEALREARGARGLSLEQAAQDTRISLRFLEALEAEEFEELPAPVYVRGFMRSYANYLGIDPQPMVDELALRERGGGYAARPGSGAFYASPSRANARPAPSPNPFQPRAPEPTRAPANVTAFRASPGAEGEAEDDDRYDPGDAPDGTEPGDVYYDDWPPAATQRHARDEHRTTGLLLERESTGGGGGGRGGLVVAGLALAGIGALAAFFMLGGDDAPARPDSETPTATSTSTGNVIEVRAPTPEGTPGDVTPITSPGATGTTTGTPAAGGTATATGTAIAGAPTVANATSTPTTVIPTSTPPPPTATPTIELPTPTPAPTVVSHPQQYDECVRIPLSGEVDCGEGPYRVVCGPSGWFIDLTPYFPAESYGWTVVPSDTKGGARDAC